MPSLMVREQLAQSKQVETWQDTLVLYKGFKG
jgi:hypothetical protein